MLDLRGAAAWLLGEASQLCDALAGCVLPPDCCACRSPLAARPSRGLCATCEAQLAHNDGPRCHRCDLPGDDLCERCLAAPPPFRTLVAPFEYGGAIAELVQSAKFRGREDAAIALGGLVADDPRVRAAVAGADCLVPVPLGRARRRQRGFNQSTVLARALGRALGLPVRYALVRTRETSAQSELPLTLRWQNVAEAFAARAPCRGACVLVDDVVTSGETARQAAAALVRAGASDVIVLAAARTPRGGAAQEDLQPSWVGGREY